MYRVKFTAIIKQNEKICQIKNQIIHTLYNPAERPIDLFLDVQELLSYISTDIELVAITEWGIVLSIYKITIE